MKKGTSNQFETITEVALKKNQNQYNRTSAMRHWGKLLNKICMMQYKITVTDRFSVGHWESVIK